MKLVEAGQLGLDEPVEKYLPEFKEMQDKEGRHQVVTIRQLMSHTSGIQPNPPTRPDLFFEPVWLGRTIADVVPAIAKTPLQFEPGTLPDGGLFSSPREIQKFLQVFLTNDAQVLSHESVKAMLTQQAPGWGLGWSLDADGLFHHSGSSGTSAWADPKTGVIGVLFFQLQNAEKIAPLQSRFRRAVRGALATAP